MGDHALVETRALPSQPIDGRGGDDGVAEAAERVGPQLIAENQQDVWQVVT